tara:strand:+ start:7 stop:1134 length:1128 start_codon:yes stop_codon:yes gene_type:complete
MKLNLKKKLKCGIIGAGINSEIGKIHLSSLLIDNLWEISAASFSTSKKINILTLNHFRLVNTKIYQDYKKMIFDFKNKLDVIILVTPTFDHFNILKYLLKFNIPIISEKPLVSSINEAKKLTNKSKKNLILTVFNYSCYPAIKNLKIELNNKKIGSIKKIIVNYHLDAFTNPRAKPKKWRLKDKNTPTILLDLGCHIFQLIYFLTNMKPTSLVSSFNSIGLYKNLIDDCNCIFKIGNKIDGLISICKSDIGNKDGLSIKIIGDKGSFIWANNNPDHYQFNNLNNNQIIDRSKFKKSIQKKYSRFKPGHPEGFLEAFSNMYRDFYEIILSGGKLDNLKYYDFNLSYDCQFFLNTMNLSNIEKKWKKLNYKKYKLKN